MFKKIIITAAVLAVGVSALAGCGCQKDSGNKSTADSASSSSEMISKDDGEVKVNQKSDGDQSNDKQESSKQNSSKQESKGESKQNSQQSGSQSSKQQSSTLPQLPTEKYVLPFVPV